MRTLRQHVGEHVSAMPGGIVNDHDHAGRLARRVARRDRVPWLDK
jgi:hypothetical protein